jgi:hypothetical protein
VILVKGLPMPKQAEEKAPAVIAQELETVVRLFDLHLEASKEVGKSAGTERWPALAAIAFIVGTSLLIWALIFALICYLI